MIEFDNRECCSLWIVQDRETPDSGNIVCWLHDVRSELSRFLQPRVTIVDFEVDKQVRRDRSHFRRDPVHATGATIAVFEHRIFDWTTRHLVPGPTKQVRIKLSGFLRVVCAELIPAKRAWPVVNSSAAV